MADMTLAKRRYAPVIGFGSLIDLRVQAMRDPMREYCAMTLCWSISRTNALMNDELAKTTQPLAAQLWC